MATVTREQKAIAAWTQAMATAENYAIDPHRHIALLVQAGEQMAALLTPGSAATSPPATVTLEQLQSIEWNGWNRDEADTCPACGRDKRRGHNDVCFIAAALASAPPAAPPEDAPRKAEHLLAASGVFKGHEGLRGLANAASFWVDHPYGTRLYYGDGGMDYLHRDVLMSAVRVLDTLAASAAPPDPPGLPPRPPLNVPACDLPRYGVTWQGGKTEPLLTPMADGYWTPWHLASQALAARQSDPPGLVQLVVALIEAANRRKAAHGVARVSAEYDEAKAYEALLACDLSAPVLVTAVLVWLWPHLPSIRLVW